MTFLVNYYKKLYPLTILIILCFMQWLFSTHLVYAADGPIDIDTYWASLEETERIINALISTPTTADLTQLQTQADYWATITMVRLNDGTLLPIDHSHLIAQLQATPPDLPALKNLLNTLLNARQNWPYTPLNGDELDKLTAVLGQSQFQWVSEQDNLLQKWWTELKNRWRAFLSNLLAPVDGLISLGVEYILPVISVFVLIWVLIYIMRGLISDFVTEKTLEATDLEHEVLTAKTALNKAQTFSGQGDYRTAVRYLYLSTLLLLEERDLLRYDRSLTNREYLHRLNQHPNLAAILLDIVDVFDRVWYGYQPIDEATYTHYAARVNTLKKYKHVERGT